MTSSVDKTQLVIHEGKFSRMNESGDSPVTEQRAQVDRRKSLRGDPLKSATGKERRKGSRRLEDVIITIEVKDPNKIYVNEDTFKKFVVKLLTREFEEVYDAESPDSVLNFIRRSEKILIETKLKYRDKVKRFVLAKGLTFEVIDDGIYLGGTNKKVHLTEEKSDGPAETDTHEIAEISTVIGFSPEDLKKEIDNLVFKVFVKCLNEVHPVSGDHERDALKQNVSLEQRIIFMAGKHYPKSENFTYKTIVDQVVSKLLKEYNKIIQLDAELSMLEERFRLSNDGNLKVVITSKTEELERLKSGSTEETVRTLYLYLDYFKEITKVGAIRERIENIFKKVNEKQLEVLNLDKICQQLHQVVELEDKILERKPDNQTEYLGFVKWLKEEITNEVYFTRHLWINNMKGKSYIDNAIERTMQAIEL